MRFFLGGRLPEKQQVGHLCPTYEQCRLNGFQTAFRPKRAVDFAKVFRLCTPHAGSLKTWQPLSTVIAVQVGILFQILYLIVY